MSVSDFPVVNLCIALLHIRGKVRKLQVIIKVRMVKFLVKVTS